MAKIETTLPTVQYGNVKVTFTPEELGVDISDAAAIGVATAVYLNLFTQGFKAGSQMDVSAPVSASQEAPEEKAQAMLDEGLGGVTELPEDGDDVEAKAPWEAKVDAKPKPWETDEKPAPVALTPGW
ncbi:MAG TPA: hypothetical protein VIY48_15645 [Candidatus Paceibacterota bacterium]